jgi:hypothetical protein
MATRTIAEDQAAFQQWYEEWLTADESVWGPRTPESLLQYFKARVCAHFGPA